MSTITTTTQSEEQQLNQTISQTITKLKNNPREAHASFGINSKLKNGFLSENKAREFKFLVDEPKELGGSNKAPSPVEYVLGALAACQEIVIKVHASQLGIELKSVKVVTEGDLDLKGLFNISDDSRAGFNYVRYHTVIETQETDKEKLRKLKEISKKRCPVLDIIQNPVNVEGKVSYVNLNADS